MKVAPKSIATLDKEDILDISDDQFKLYMKLRPVEYNYKSEKLKYNDEQKLKKYNEMMKNRKLKAIELKFKSETGCSTIKRLSKEQYDKISNMMNDLIDNDNPNIDQWMEIDENDLKIYREMENNVNMTEQNELINKYDTLREKILKETIEPKLIKTHGFVLHELALTNPSLVYSDEDDNLDGIYYNTLHALHVYIIQQQQKKLNDLEARILKLES
jgi:hypothetical protein